MFKIFSKKYRPKKKYALKLITFIYGCFRNRKNNLKQEDTQNKKKTLNTSIFFNTLSNKSIDNSVCTKITLLQTCLSPFNIINFAVYIFSNFFHII